MLEEKNDNLSVENNQTDGNENSVINEVNSIENQEIEVATEVDGLILDVIPDTEVEAPLVEETAAEKVLEVEDLIGEQITEEPKKVPTMANTATITSSLPDNIIELTDEEVANDEMVIEPINHSDEDVVMNAIANSNAEESEDETIKDRHDIPMLDYETLNMEKLVEELEKLVLVDKVMSVKDHVEEIKRVFLSKYEHLIDEKKDEFHTENPDTTEEFQYNFPLKLKFDDLYNHYKSRKNKHFKSLQNNLNQNLANREALVEELKELVNNPSGNITASLKQLNDIRERWKVAGPIPKDKYNHVWNNYHFHIENFYDFLHIDRDARDQEFKNNLELKEKIIARVSELLQETDINKAFRELQDLHKIWKEDIGPVSREMREPIWNKFSDLTKQMHDKRMAFFESFKATENENLEKKRNIIAQLETLSKENVASHALWLKQIEKVESLRNEFFTTGKVPSEENENTWAAFKLAVRNFNILKNSFYKEIKKDQNENLAKKQALVDKANELKDSEDFATTTETMKQIQEEWKHIGHIPRKYSDKLWQEFRAACNHYFERLKDNRKEENAEEVAAFEKKKEYLEIIKEFQLVGDHKTDLDAIKKHIENWKSLGKVPFNRRHVEGKFNKILDALFEKLSSSKKEGEMMRFANKISNLADNDNGRKLENESFFIRKKIDETQSEIFQLENNIQFFANASEDNPLVKEVLKNIERHKEDLLIWKAKLKQIRNLNLE
jgi:hypothetical protein